MEHAQNFDEQSYDESFVDYIGETLRERKVSRENFDKLSVIRQICQFFPLSTICTSYSYMVYNMSSRQPKHQLQLYMNE